MGAALTHLIPVSELAPGAISFIRNEVLKDLLARASKQLSLPEDKLVVRDLRWVEDLQAYSSGTTASTINDWLFTTAATTVTGFITVTGDKTMGDERFVALYGVKDLRRVYDVKQAAATTGAVLSQVVSLIKIAVGGGDKVIWDLSKLQVYPESLAGFTPSAVIIPQNSAFNISIYKANGVASVIANIVLEGLVVEPRGKVISP